jgi:hypothetical protein
MICSHLALDLMVNFGLSQSVVALVSQEVLIAVPVDVTRADQCPQLFRLQLLRTVKMYHAASFDLIVEQRHGTQICGS